SFVLIFFFFSSRRRHTRSKRDWSSDVCSSDLINLTSVRDPQEILTRHFGESFFLAHQLFSDEPMNRSSDGPIIFDLGSGAGFPEIGRASCRERVEISVVTGTVKEQEGVTRM